MEGTLNIYSVSQANMTKVIIGRLYQISKGIYTNGLHVYYISYVGTHIFGEKTNDQGVGQDQCSSLSDTDPSTLFSKKHF